MKICELLFGVEYWFCNADGTGIFRDKVSDILVSAKDNRVILHLDRNTLRFESLNSCVNAFNSLNEAKEYASSLMENTKKLNTPTQGVLF